jgi:protein-tyrosine phosphatase
VTAQWITLDGAVNARVVVPGVLLRSDNLQALTVHDVRVLVDGYALEVVLDLRTEVELELEGPGPLAGESHVRVEHRSLYPQLGSKTDLDGAIKPWGETGGDEWPDETPVVQAYMNYLSARPDSIVSSVRTIATARGATLVHCAAGKDRTGVVVAMALDAAGLNRELIVGDYLATAERVEAIVARLRSSPTYRAELKDHDPQRHAPLPDTMPRFLALIDVRHGGTREWLAAQGMSDRELQQLQQRLNPRTAR